MKEAVKDGSALEIRADLESNFVRISTLSEPAQLYLYETYSKLFLGYFNAECEAAVRSLRSTSNYSTAHNRILRAYTAMHKVSVHIGFVISERFRDLRLRELELVWKHLVAKVAEHEEAQAERERLRDEDRAQKEYERAVGDLEKELEHYLTMVEQMHYTGDQEAEERYRLQAENVRERIADVEERAANRRVGYVYVISNIGSFGEGVVKIGMTRRLEPMNRVRELSNASVPFRYDVHALVFSADALALEAALHHRFEGRRVNRVNRRREFFRTTPREVLEMLSEFEADLVDWIEDPEAVEFRLTQGLDPQAR